MNSKVGSLINIPLPSYKIGLRRRPAGGVIQSDNEEEKGDGRKKKLSEKKRGTLRKMGRTVRRLSGNRKLMQTKCEQKRKRVRRPLTTARPNGETKIT
jgi:hypothetical protein